MYVIAYISKGLSLACSGCNKKWKLEKEGYDQVSYPGPESVGSFCDFCHKELPDTDGCRRGDQSQSGFSAETKKGHEGEKDKNSRTAP